MPTVLSGALPIDEIDQLVRKGRLDIVLEEHSRVILGASMGLTARERTALKAIWDKMRDRRMARRRKKTTEVPR